MWRLLIKVLRKRKHHQRQAQHLHAGLRHCRPRQVQHLHADLLPCLQRQAVQTLHVQARRAQQQVEKRQEDHLHCHPRQETGQTRGHRPGLHHRFQRRRTKRRCKKPPALDLSSNLPVQRSRLAMKEKLLACKAANLVANRKQNHVQCLLWHVQGRQMICLQKQARAYLRRP